MMFTKNQKPPIITSTITAKVPARTVPMDGVRLVKKPQRGQPVRVRVTFSRRRRAPATSPGPSAAQPRFVRFRKVQRYIIANSAAMLTAAGLLLAFGLGAWYSASTPQSAAEDRLQPQVAGASVFAPIPLAAAPSTTPAAISNDQLFNTPIESLKAYMAAKASESQMASRKLKLHEFLKGYGSPLEPYADLIAEQDHWKLLLAISFAESTLCKRQVDNNCSGIGVAPGHPLWRKYKTLGHWALDLNRLLEKRYKGHTLEQMCGVYVQPCNPNWLLATKQILTQLERDNIE